MSAVPRPTLVQALLAAATVFALAALGLAGWITWREARVQGWAALGLEWLALDRLAGVRAFLPALVAAGAAFVLVLAARRVSALAALGARVRLGFLAHPLSVVLALLGAFVLPGVVARGTRPVPARQAPNVLFILIDTWRADHTGFLGYERDVSPSLDRLAAEGVVFERAMAQSSWTKPSVATLLTGLTPSRHHAVSQAIPEKPVRAFRLNPRLTTFVELLHGKGWQTAMWSDNPNITPPIGFDQGAEHFRDYFHEPCCPERCGELPEILADVDTWFAEQRDASRPFCLYVHVMDAHYPFEPPPEFAGRFDTAPSDLQLTGPIVHDYMTGKRSEANLTEERLASLVARYDEELLAIDHQLGAFLEQVRREHPNTVIVVSGDHGEEFYEHGNLGHSHALWQELVHVPLLLWAPDLAPARVASQVRLMDVCPTILELVGLPGALPGLQGESLLPMVAGRETADRPAPMEVGGDQKPCWQWRGLSDGRTKLLRRENDLPTLHPIPPIFPDDGAARPFAHLYDLVRDPRERTNLAAERAADVNALFAELQRRGWYTPPETLLGLQASALELDPELTGELSALGYGGGEDEGEHAP
ncbi:MAG TPA: sulfatase [Planctomycetota bacterium]